MIQPLDEDGKPVEGFDKLNAYLDEHFEEVKRKLEAEGKAGNVTPEEYKKLFFEDFDDTIFSTYDEPDEKRAQIKKERQERKYKERLAKQEKKDKAEEKAKAKKEEPVSKL